MPLITLILLPFIGSLLAAVLPSNARNTESTLAGLIALFCTADEGITPACLASTDGSALPWSRAACCC